MYSALCSEEVITDHCSLFGGAKIKIKQELNHPAVCTVLMFPAYEEFWQSAEYEE